MRYFISYEVSVKNTNNKWCHNMEYTTKNPIKDIKDIRLIEKDLTREHNEKGPVVGILTILNYQRFGGK